LSLYKTNRAKRWPKKSSQRSPFQSIFDTYLDALFDLTRRGDAREESYYPTLKTLLEALAKAQGLAVQVTMLPKPTEAGNPDFCVWDGSHQVIGYVEAKPPGTRLDTVEDSDQLRRYRHTFPNLILTDFYEFRLYRDGEPLQSACLPHSAQKQKSRPTPEQIRQLMDLLENFFSFALPPSFTAESLARELARRTRILRDQVILPELQKQVEAEDGDLYGFYEAFQKYLIAALSRNSLPICMPRRSPMDFSRPAPAPTVRSTARSPLTLSLRRSASSGIFFTSFRSANSRPRWKRSWTTSLLC